MKNFDIVKWAKEEQLALSKMDVNSKYVARYIECTLLPKLEEIFHTSSNKQSTPCLCPACKSDFVNYKCSDCGYTFTILRTGKPTERGTPSVFSRGMKVSHRHFQKDNV